MKLKESKLRQIAKEEIQRVLKEGDFKGGTMHQRIEFTFPESELEKVEAIFDSLNIHQEDIPFISDSNIGRDRKYSHWFRIEGITAAKRAQRIQKSFDNFDVIYNKEVLG